jgi:antitoxin VapB
MPTLNIKDGEVHRLASELARRTGESITTAVRVALQERLAHELKRNQTSDRRAEERVRAAMARIAQLPVLDSRPADEILGYNESGVWDDH